MHQIKPLNDIEAANKIAEFLTSEFAFDQTWAPNERKLVQESVVKSLENPNHQYWYVESDGKIIGAMGVRENKYGSGGYEMDADYFAVHKDYRRQGIANMLLKQLESFVEEQNGRYIHVLSCDIDSYKPAISFYESNGYHKVSHLPNYYVPGEGRIDLYKEF